MSNKYTKKPSKKDSRSKDYRGSKTRDNRKGPDKSDPIEKTGLDNRGRDNDPNDYMFSKELAEQVTQLSFQNMLGLGSMNGYEIPTIAVVKMNPSPGISFELEESAQYDGWKEDPDVLAPQPEVTNVRAGLNMMCMKLYTLLATFSGRTSNYGPQDVGVMILAIAAVAELSEHLRRMFGVALTYNARNRIMPVELLRSMGLDVDDFMANISDYRMRFNIQMSRINQIPLLDNIGYIRKARNMYKKVYQDDPSSMAQIFYWAPNSTWTIDETSYSGGTVLTKTNVLDSSSTKMSVLLNRLANMITALLESTTLNLIYADLLNLANKIKVPTWQFDYLAENYIVMPEYNQTASLQFHNINVVGEPEVIGSSVADGVVTPTGWEVPFTRSNHVYTDANTNSLVYNPVFWGTNKCRPSSIVDMFTDSPDVVDRIEALRMSAIPSGWAIKGERVSAGSVSNFGIFPAISDHYVVDVIVYGNKVANGGQHINRFAYNRDTESDHAFIKVMSSLEVFDHAPLIDFYDTYDLGMDTIARTGDVTYYTEIPYEYLKKVNNMMFVGLFDFRV